MSTKIIISMILVSVLSVVITKTFADQEAKHNRVIEAEQFVIIDANNKPVARISALADGWPGIGVSFGSNPKGVISIMCAKEMLVINMQSPTSMTTARIGVFDKQASLEMDRGTTKTCQAAIGFEANGEPILRLIDDKGNNVPPGIKSPSSMPSRP